MATTISTDEQHRATLAVLQEAVDYMRRLPPVPVTLEICRKLQRHLDDPTNRLVARQKDIWRGSAFEVVGTEYLTARLEGDVLTVRLPAPTRSVTREYIQQLAMDRLRAGVQIRMENCGFDPFEGND